MSNNQKKQDKYADKEVSVNENIQKSYDNAETETYLYCLKRKIIRKSEKRNIYAGIPDLKVANNKIETSKYNYITFLPKNLLVQFSKLANIYFIIVGICQIIPQISTTQGKPVVYIPLTVVVLISMVKDFLEDRKRRKQDEFENKSITKRLNTDTGTFEQTTWESLSIGDIIQVQDNQRFPADILVLSSSGKNGTCYIETKNLDGETNLKHRQSCAPGTFLNESMFKDQKNIGRFDFDYEVPNPQIHRFNGIMKDKEEKDVNKRQIILNLSNICLRGCTLKRTQQITGVVIYSGHDCKSLKYASTPHYKFGTIEKIMNKMVVFVFAILVSIAIFCASYYIIWYNIKEDELPYLHIGPNDFESIPPANFFLRIPMWVLLLNTFVPISLLVTLEIVKYLQGQILSKDKNFINNLSSELVEVNGSVKYILTDKTGTLTANIMKFKAISLNGNSYEHTQYDDNGILKNKQLIEKLRDPKQYNLEYETFLCMNLCHQLIVEERQGKKHYLSNSADEEAIMEFCVESGIYLEEDDENNCRFLTNKLTNKKLKFQIIALHEYRSELRKMSILVKDCQTNEIKLYQKGAMSNIFDCLRKDQFTMRKILEEHLDNFASNMLRTLCLSYRVLSEQEFKAFMNMRHERLKSGNLDIQKIDDDTFATIEDQQILLGGTGLNDEFGDQVVPTLQNLKKAGIKIWMITGDKKQTALSIGIKCGIVEKDVELKVIDEDSEHIDDNKLLQQVNEIAEDIGKKKISVGLSGLVFAHMHKNRSFELDRAFYKIMKTAESVIAFHFSPRQKQQLVELVHIISPGQCVLSIGDGANDVRMLQTAHVGIGIRGKEGREAAKASDFSIAEFKHLNRLLLYVGQEAYRKNSYLILFNFYKNQAWNLIYFWYNFYSGQSAQYIYDQWMSQFFNLFYVSLPIIIYALFDEIHPANEFFQLRQTKPNLLEKQPLKYKKFTDNLIFTQLTFVKWFFRGSIHGLMIMFISFLSVGEFSDRHGKQLDIFYQGVHAYTCCVILGNLKVLQLHKTHYFLTFFVIYGSIGFYMSNIYAASKVISLDSYGVLKSLFNQPNTYFGFLIMIFVTYGIDSAFEIFFSSASNANPSQEEKNVQLVVSSSQDKSNQIIKQNISDAYNTKQNLTDERSKKEIENSNGDINKNLLIYPTKSPSVTNNHNRSNNADSQNQLEEEEPYFEEDNVIDNNNNKNQLQQPISQNPLTNKPASPSGLIQKADKY